MKNAVLIQHAYGRYFTEDYRPMIELVRERHQAYADKWQMDYLVAFGAVKTEWKADNGGWAKLELVRLMLEKGYEYVFFVDADAMIVDMNTDLREGCPDGLGMVVHNGPGTPGPHMNVGIMFVKNSERIRALFVEWASRYPGTTTFPWYEQGEAHKMRSEDKWKDLIIEIPAKWNSCLAAANHVNDAVIEGWHGMGNAVQRYQQMKGYLEILKQKETEGTISVALPIGER